VYFQNKAKFGEYRKNPFTESYQKDKGGSCKKPFIREQHYLHQVVGNE
jgi:hypothetical protein